MEIKIPSAKAHNFKAHRDLSVNFGRITQITGDNAQGKSSILEIPTWTLYGTDTMGSKLDPSPTNYEYDAVLSETLLDIDGKQVLLGRGIEKEKPLITLTRSRARPETSTRLLNLYSTKTCSYRSITPLIFSRFTGALSGIYCCGM